MITRVMMTDRITTFVTVWCVCWTSSQCYFDAKTLAISFTSHSR